MSYLQRELRETMAVTLAASLRACGVSLTIGYDFDVYKKLAEGARPNHTVGRPFDPELNELNSRNAYWVIGRDAQGEIVHTQAIRLLDIGEESVANYLTKRYVDFPPPIPGVDLARSRFRPGPAAMRMFGRVSYHGEFWIGGDAGKFRGAGLAADLARFGYEQAMRHWDPDHFFAFMIDPVANKGLAARAGWMHTQPRALSWAIEGREQLIDTFMCHISRDDLHYLLMLSAEDEEAAKLASAA